ncbi:MAG: class I SAM-dependent methyltransferase, partial [Candidatus Delongbacteria bacterium]|nr:class I SAM-dependent methyltransferase [Candidatus Delongbacteria bacterium]
MDYSRYWSLTQQTISTLNKQRKLRFNSNNVQKIIQYFEIKPDKNLLDSGCGTGVLLESISNYYMNGISLTGVDRDSSFIEEANSKNISNSQ